MKIGRNNDFRKGALSVIFTAPKLKFGHPESKIGRCHQISRDKLLYNHLLTTSEHHFPLEHGAKIEIMKNRCLTSLKNDILVDFFVELPTCFVLVQSDAGFFGGNSPLSLEKPEAQRVISKDEEETQGVDFIIRK